MDNKEPIFIHSNILHGWKRRFAVFQNYWITSDYIAYICLLTYSRTIFYKFSGDYKSVY